MVVIDQAATRRHSPEWLPLHGIEPGGVEQVARLRRERNVETTTSAPATTFVERLALDADCGERLVRRHRVISPQAKTKGSKLARSRAPIRPSPTSPTTISLARRMASRPSASADQRPAADRAARRAATADQRQDHGDRMRGDLIGARVGTLATAMPAFLSRIDVDIVEPRAKPADDLELRQCVQDARAVIGSLSTRSASASRQLAINASSVSGQALAKNQRRGRRTRRGSGRAQG